MPGCGRRRSLGNATVHVGIFRACLAGPAFATDGRMVERSQAGIATAMDGMWGNVHAGQI